MKVSSLSLAACAGLVDRGCAMAWGESCNCGDDCKCVNCPQHMKKVGQDVRQQVGPSLSLQASAAVHSVRTVVPAGAMSTGLFHERSAVQVLFIS